MKMITPEKLVRSLTEGVFEVEVDEIAPSSAWHVERMVAMGQPVCGG